MIEDLIRRLTRLERFIDGLIKPEVGQWQDWTPTVTQLGGVTVTVSYARYAVIANTVILLARLVVTGTGTANNAIVISGIPTPILPSLATSSTTMVGHLLVLDTGTAYYHTPLVYVGANNFLGIYPAGGNYVGITPNFGLVSGDEISFQATYERA